MRYLCINDCFFGGRLYQKDSPIEKDAIYSGAETPPAACFREIKAGETIVMRDDKPEVTALSELQTKNENVKEKKNTPVLNDGVFE